MEWWNEFAGLMMTSEHFRAGFFLALGIVVLAWLAWGVLFRLHVQWLKIRQFFEPIKKPGKMPTETGPSPASMMLGCFGRFIFTVLLPAVVVVALLWFLNSPGS